MQCTPDNLRDIYNKFAPEYDRHIAWLEKIAGLRSMRQNLFQKAQGNVLDVATGTGANYEFFPSSCSITGVDLSKEMLALAKDRAQSLKKDVTLDSMDAQDLQYPSESFDTVVSALSLCTIPDPLKGLHEISRVCKRGGKILLLEHGPSNWKLIATLQKILVGDWHVRKFGCHWDRESDLLVKQAGLVPLTHERQFFGVLHALEIEKQ